MPFKDINETQSWEKYGTSSVIIRRVGTDFKYLNNEVKLTSDGFPSGYPFDQKRSYQYLTKISAITTGPIQPLTMELETPFSSGIFSKTRLLSITTSATFYSYATPNSSDLNKVLVKYGASSSFTTCGIASAKMNEIDFIVNGYREFSYDSLDFNDTLQPSGWVHTGNNTLLPPDTGASYSFRYEWMSNNGSISPSYSTFGVNNNLPISDNYLAKLIDYDSFNLKFDYDSNTSDYGISLYLAKSNKLNTKSQWVKIDSITQSGSYEWASLAGTTDGVKNYLIISASESNTQFLCSLFDIYVYGGYHPSNNRQFEPLPESNNIKVDIPYASYLFDIKNNGITSSLTSKIGNGLFKSGIWENGVWNNGWRDDNSAQDLDDVEYSILTRSDVSWKIKIKGAVSTIKNDDGSFKFKAGDKVTIGNIIAIDINDNRKLLKGQYTIESTGTETLSNGLSQGFIIVNLDTTFPYRRIERDSPNHKIKITKNIWLSGAFFNGYFSGVWNNGLFRGYPLITEMFNTHWIDGFFNGGHFESHYPEFNFNKIEPRDFCAAGYTNITMDGTHDIKPGDYIFVEFNNLSEFESAGGVNNYDGLVRVLAVNGSIITINRLFSGNTGLSDSDGLGKVQRYTSTGLIQNFKFYDNNRSKVKSSESNISSSVFSYDSWIDVNYDNSRSVTLGRDFRAYEPLTGKSINRNNLFGYPTYDVLSSASRFRDSNTLDIKLYKLGTKYKVFTDFIGEFSEFNEPFNPDIDFSNFFLGGWSYSYINSGDIKFNRTESIISVNDSNAQNYIDSGVTGDELFVYATSSGAVINNSMLDLAKGRYSVAEFDIITHSVTSYEYTFENLDVFSSTSLLINSPFTFNSLNSESNSESKGIIALNDNLSISDVYDFGSGFSYSNTESSSTIINLSDGSIVVGGYQTHYGDYLLTSKYISKILSDGTIDTTFDTNFGNILTGIPTRIIADSSDNVYLIAPGITNGRRLIKIDPSGNIDTTFNIKSNGTFTDIALDSSNNVVMVGSFATFSYGPTNIVVSKNKIARLLSSGLNDASFNIGTGFSLTSDKPYTVEIDTSDDIYVGGNIKRYNSVSDNINGIVKIINSGTKDTSFLTATTDGFTPNGTSLNVTVRKIVYSSGSLYVGGNFTQFKKATSTILINRLAKIDSTTGAIDTTFNVISGFNKEINSIGLLGADKLVVTCVTSGASYRNTAIKNGIVILNRNSASLLSSCAGDFLQTGAQGTLNAIIQDFTIINDNILGVGQMDGYAGGLKEISSSYSVAQSLDDSSELNNIEVSINITQTDVSKLTINLRTPSGDVINLKSSGNGSGSNMLDTIFSSNDIYPFISLSTAPYSGTFRMDKILNLGNTIQSNVTEISDSDVFGDWVLYIKDDNTLSLTTLNSWSIKFNYDLFDSDFINNEPLAKFPIINFSNLNYEISTQRSGEQTVQVYKKMNYLPVSGNINHLLTTNTFRLDSLERAIPEQWGGFGKNLQTKKFEYFYNKTDLMMNISGNGFLGASSSTIVLDNIKLYEVDMIPFFKYFNDANIYKGVQIPYSGVAPEIDYLDTDFVFVDNIAVGLDTINTSIELNDVVCTQETVDINDFTINLPNLVIDGSLSGTQDIIAVATLTGVSSQVLSNYQITWQLGIGNNLSEQIGNGNVGNSPSVNLNNLTNSTVYNLTVTIINNGIEHSASSTVTVGSVVTTTVPTTTVPTTTVPTTTSPGGNVTWYVEVESNDIGLEFPFCKLNYYIYKNGTTNTDIILNQTITASGNHVNIATNSATGTLTYAIGDRLYLNSTIVGKTRFTPFLSYNIIEKRITTGIPTILDSQDISGGENSTISLNSFTNSILIRSGYSYRVEVFATNTAGIM